MDREVIINGRVIQPYHGVFVVAEIGSNWGPLDDEAMIRCYTMIDQVAWAGADAIKFQLFDKLYRDPERQARIDPYRLPIDWLAGLAEHAHDLELSFGVTPLYLEAVDAAAPYVDFFKVASGDLVWQPLLMRLRKVGLPVILSTGAARPGEVEEARNILEDIPHVILHCVSAYPARYQDCNMRVIREWPDALEGWSDHTVEPLAVLAAVARGASVIECHVGEGIESGHSWAFDQLATLVKDIRKMERILGEADKRPVVAEQAERINARRGVDGLRPAFGGGT